MIKWNSISILLTDKCNIKCEHCMIEAGPEGKELIDINAIGDIAKGLREMEINIVGITGGEPLLFKKELKTVCLELKENKIKSILATNAFWASTLQEGCDLVAQMKDWGVAYIVFSFDEFHQKWIPAQSVFNAVRAAVQHDINYEVHISAVDALTAKKYHDKLVEQSISKIIINAVEIAGRAKKLEYKDKNDVDLRSFSCGKVLNPLILPNGDVVACCDLPVAREFEVGVGNPLLLGNIYENDICRILRRASINPYLNLLLEHGPDGILKKISELDPSFKLEGDKYQGCMLCHRLSKDEKLIGKLCEEFIPNTQ